MKKMSEYKKLVIVILFAIALAMGIVSIVLLNLGETTSTLNLIALGLASVGLGGIIQNSK
jgi:hypothetical protein